MKQSIRFLNMFSVIPHKEEFLKLAYWAFTEEAEQGSKASTIVHSNPIA